MAPSIAVAKSSLSYPLYGADFDPEDDRFLLVGGGGGEGRSGVGNKITLLDASSPSTLTQVAEIDLSRDEDSVTSLAVAHRTGKNKTLALAGINSSTAAQAANQNEHLRSFAVHYPSRKSQNASGKGSGSITATARASRFSPSTAVKKETYQRVLRLSPMRKPATTSRLAAIATGLAPEGEIVLLDSASTTSRGRINLGKGEEAADVDIIEASDKEYHVAYCTTYEIARCTVRRSASPAKDKLDPQVVWVCPHPDVFASEKARPSFRALRFLTPSLLLVLSNRPKRTGAELSILRISGRFGEVIGRKVLHRSMKAATGLDVTVLGHSLQDGYQAVIAVSGQDASIEMLAVDIKPSGEPSGFRVFAILRDVHPLQITRVCLSTFFPPPPPTPTRKNASLASAPLPPQYIKLASVSVGNTVVVHTLPLTTTPGPGRSRRYVLVSPSWFSTPTRAVLASLIVILLAILLQGYFGVGRSPGGLGRMGLQNVVPQAKVADPSLNGAPLQDDIGSGMTSKAGVMVRDGPDAPQVQTQPANVLEKEGKPWHELQPHEKERWKQKLAAAGQWTLEEGETVLEALFFGEMGAVVGQAVGG
ncbi:MAG: hypothetical protein M1838_004801 [Thelocarpon superellum]|nr:MAG: hypothetical protein M1838_004801 [Thelocarpon superellum]